jgi:pyruvate formate lyase activating enzyme
MTHCGSCDSRKVAPSRPAGALRVAGITPFTTIDFPGKLSAVVFVQGCPWRCAYCHNPWMQSRDFAPELEHGSWEEVERLLARRRGLLDGVVFSGGEPTIDPALPDAVRRVREWGFAVGLHTGGAYPARLAEILSDLEWVGLDVKASPDSPEKFEAVVSAKGATARFLEVFRRVRESGVRFECRTTAHPDYLANDDLLELARWLEREEVENFALQIYRRPPGLIAPFGSVGDDYPSEEARAALRGAVKHYVERRS